MRTYYELPDMLDDLDFELLTMSDEDVDAFAYEAAAEAEARLAVETVRPVAHRRDLETAQRFLQISKRPDRPDSPLRPAA